MTDPAYPMTGHDYSSDDEELRHFEQAMAGGPRGAVTVSGIAVGLLLLCWLAISRKLAPEEREQLALYFEGTL